MCPGGLEVPGGAAGLLSLSLTLFRGCVQAFEIFFNQLHTLVVKQTISDASWNWNSTNWYSGRSG